MMPHAISRLRGFLGTETVPLGHAEKLISAAGGFLGIFLVYLTSVALLGPAGAPWIVTSIGSSAVLLFAVPHGPMSQPWALVGGNLVSAVIGVLAVSLFQLAPHALPDPMAIAILVATVTALLVWRVGTLRLMIAGSVLGVLRSRLFSLPGARAAF